MIGRFSLTVLVLVKKCFDSWRVIIPNQGSPRVPCSARRRELSVSTEDILLTIVRTSFLLCLDCPKIVDAEVIKEVAGARSRFPQLPWQYELMTCCGTNFVVSEGHGWRRQRKVTARAFTESSDGVWRGRDEIVVDCILDLTFPIWVLYAMDALHHVLTEEWLKAFNFVPDWAIRY
ncbi:hypothetical protein AcV5_001253 [Taiwanofungus camphoratus]|nr:hypothetical protein AcV5_001253 [Antrodia cinnamomea]